MKDLTEGKPGKVLWQFSIPMFVSVIFQQMYNIADSVIAGKFAGEDALAAVGASYPITMIFMAIAVGSNIGCSVIISNLFGAKKYKEMKTAVTTTLIAAFAISVVLTVLGLAGTGALMQMIHTPDNIFDAGALYLGIYIGGFTFLFLYNVATGIFSALGDSKTPLYFLMASSIGNILLDYLFVAEFQWGVAGVAWATFLAQGAASILALLTMAGRLKTVETEGKAKLFSWKMLRKVSQIAVPSIFQQSFISIGNIFIQGLVNSFGSSVIAGYSAAIKLNTFAITSFTTLGNGISNFTAQKRKGARGISCRSQNGDACGASFLYGFLHFWQTDDLSVYDGGKRGGAADRSGIFVHHFPFLFPDRGKIDGRRGIERGGSHETVYGGYFCGSGASRDSCFYSVRKS